MIRAWLLALICLAAASHPAAAEIRSLSYSVWDVLGDTVHLRVMMPIAEAGHLARPGSPPPLMDSVKSYVADHVGVTADGRPCPPVDQGEEAGFINSLSLTPGLYRFEVLFQCAAPGDIVLRNDVLLDRVPDHVDFARVQVEGGGFVPRLFSAGHERLSAASTGGLFGDAGLLRYLRLGLAHVVLHLDRVSFVLGLMLIALLRRDAGFIVAGLALGYTLSLALSLSGLVMPRLDLTEAVIGFMTALVAADSVAVVSRRPALVALGLGLCLLVAALGASALGMSARLLLAGLGIFAASYLLLADRVADRSRFWLLPTGLFALLDGAGLPADLAVLAPPWPQLAPMLIGFDLGAILAEVMLLATVAIGIALLRRFRLTMPQPVMIDLGAATLAGLGTFWFVSRLYG